MPSETDPRTHVHSVPVESQRTEDARAPQPTMTARLKKSKWLDFASVGLSGLCVVHCLALPLLAAVLPLAGALAHDPWVHPLLVLIAAPLSLSAIHTSKAWRKLPVVALILAGLTLLALAAFVPALENVETLLSVTGALAIASAHWVNYRSQHRHVHSGHTHAVGHACQPAAD